MRPRLRLRLMGGVAVLLAFCGLWIAHAAEYARAYGAREALAVLAGSVHLYMIPLGAGLAISAALASSRLLALWLRLGARLDSVRAQIAAALIGRPAKADASSLLVSEPPGTSRVARFLVAWPALTTLQLALYLAQENLEALRAGTAAPGFGAVTGVHALAPAVHAAVALVLLVLVLVADAMLSRRARVLTMKARQLHRLLQRFERGVARFARGKIAVQPAWLLATARLRRPPPFASSC